MGEVVLGEEHEEEGDEEVGEDEEGRRGIVRDGGQVGRGGGERLAAGLRHRRREEEREEPQQQRCLVVGIAGVRRQPRLHQVEALLYCSAWLINK